MKHFLDTELKGHALVFDGPLDLIDHAEQANSGPTPFHRLSPISWPGRQARTWKEAREFLRKPWPEAMGRVQYVADGIRAADLPTPKSVKRKLRRNEDDGEIDLDRALRGDPDMYTDFKRNRVMGPLSVTLLGNIDASVGHHCNSSGVFFRSSCSIALADVLESLGYSVEIVLWNRGHSVYPMPNHRQFVTCKVKKFGDPVDISAACDAMSSWFTTEAIFGSFAAGPVRPLSTGAAVYENYSATCLADSGCGPWAKYMDVDQNSVVLPIPMISGWGIEDGLRKGIEVARKVLDRLIAIQEGRDV